MVSTTKNDAQKVESKYAQQDEHGHKGFDVRQFNTLLLLARASARKHDLSKRKTKKWFTERL